MEMFERNFRWQDKGSVGPCTKDDYICENKVNLYKTL